MKIKKAALDAEAKKREEVAHGTYVKPSHEILAELDRPCRSGSVRPSPES